MVMRPVWQAAPSAAADPAAGCEKVSSMASGTWSTQVVSTFEDLLALRPEWQELETTSGTDLPFHTWEWAITWWEHFHEDRRAVRDSLSACVVRHQGQVVGIAPLMLTERPSFGPFRARFVQFLGADPNITEIRSMLCHPQWEQECYQAVRDHLVARTGEWDWIAWEGLGPGIYVGTLNTAAEPDQNQRVAFVLPLPATWEAFVKGLHRSIRGSLRRYDSALAKDGLRSRLEVFETPASIPGALNDFFRLYATRESTKGSRSQAELFASPRAEAFLTNVCTRLAERGVTKIFRFWVNDQLVATRIGFEIRDTLYLYYSGWDPAYSQYSVMTLLVAQAFRYAIQRGLKTVHLSTGRDLSKTRWAPAEIRYAGGVELAPRKSARAIQFVYDRAMRLGKSGLARTLIPSTMTRTLRPTEALAPGPEPARLSRFHGFATAFALFIILDLLDGVLDRTVQLLPRIQV
jgi:CelD/BcsL family acetyltransferase involved in cellulose biosynthesis